MLTSQRPKALLLLADGTAFEGRAIGATGTTVGEICFNTGMTGYQEIFSDPSYTGQIMVLATAHVGNYGVKDGEGESASPKIAGLVVKKYSEVWSRPGATSSLDDQLKAAGVVGISDIDTRKLVRHIRDHGAQNALICNEQPLHLDVLKLRLQTAPNMAGLELSSQVTGKAARIEGAADASYRVALVDFGTKENIVRCLTERGCQVQVFPMSTPLSTMLAWEPHGFVLSNGPGDPGAMPASVALVKEILATGLPVFGICLGHQLLAESQGIPTEKMHHGPRGINHPVKNLVTGRSEISSQNHGFVAQRAACEANADVEITHLHLNDGSVAGLRLKGRPVYSVQYHPEAGPGPYDGRYLFDDLTQLMAAHARKAAPALRNA